MFSSGRMRIQGEDIVNLMVLERKFVTSLSQTTPILSSRYRLRRRFSFRHCAKFEVTAFKCRWSHHGLPQPNTLNADLVTSGLLGLVEGSVSGLDNIIRSDQVPAPFGSTDTDGHL